MNEQKIRYRPTFPVKYVASDTDRYGTVRWYLRVPGHPKIRMPFGPDDKRFLEVYRKALANPQMVASMRSSPARRKKQGELSYVYFLVTGPAVKIGYSKKPLDRCEALKTALADPIVCLLAVPGTLRDEQAFHKEFARHRLEGEWFTMCPQITSAMAQVAAFGLAREPPKRIDWQAFINAADQSAVAS